MSNKALIIGVNCQDASYLIELLLEKQYERPEELYYSKGNSYCF